MEMAKFSSNLSFENLTLKIREGTGTKKCLNHLSGNFPSGKLVAILGPSGAGKSTLVNVLSGWDHSSTITGSVQLNNKAIQRSDIKDISCYITQEYNLINILSVAENLKYAADLKLGRRVSQNHKKEIIDNVVKTFGLAHYLETPTGKLSGGQRKRLAICLELLNDPDIIFLDEPTTGLDSVSASQCIKYLKHLTEKGKSVICTLHQPSGNLMKMFDMIYIIANGQCAYQGCADQLVTFLADNQVPCGLFHSPIDYIIDLASGEYGSKILENLINMSQNGKNMTYMPIPTKVCSVDTIIPSKQKLKAKGNSLLDDLFEINIIIRREFVIIIRDIFTTYFRMACIIGINILAGFACYDIGANANMLHYNYHLILLHMAGMTIIYAVLTGVTFSLNQEIIRNEYENGYYSITNYYLSSTIMELPVTIVTAVIGSICLYYLSGQLITLPRLSMFIFITIEMAMNAASVGYIIGSTLNLAETVYFSALIHLPLEAISGAGLTIANMPLHFYYLSHIAYTRYAVRSLMGSVFGYDKPVNVCPEEVLYCHYQYSIKFLNEVGLEDRYFVYDSLILAGFYVFFRVVAYLILRYRLKNGVYNITIL